MTSRWTTIAATVRGSAHLAGGAPNQDATAVFESAELTFVAVADGHGAPTSPRSAIGADLAVSAAVEAATGIDPDVGDSLRKLTVDIVERWRHAVDRHHVAEPLSEDEHRQLAGGTVRCAYGTTLLAAGVTPTIGFAMQLGDGDILLVAADGTSEPAFPTWSAPSTETDSLCSVDAAERASTRWWPIDGNHPRLVTVSSDGFGAAFEDRVWYRTVGEQLVGHVRDGGPEHVRRRLSGWLARNAAEYGDDTSMAILIAPDLGPAGQGDG